uniref:Uncharacterized protein n=1 Tax=Panagrolaimus davidi TaxID=227884 RepID=A0A914QS61_9BILA
MEDFYVIPIEYEWKISEEKLETLADPWHPAKVISGQKRLQQCPGIIYGLKADIGGNDKNEEVLNIILCFYGSSFDELTIHGKFACFVKSANFATSFDSFTDAHDGDTRYGMLHSIIIIANNFFKMIGCMKFVQ